jgi:hypothetical protein
MYFGAVLTDPVVISGMTTSVLLWRPTDFASINPEEDLEER